MSSYANTEESRIVKLLEAFQKEVRIGFLTDNNTIEAVQGDNSQNVTWLTKGLIILGIFLDPKITYNQYIQQQKEQKALVDEYYAGLKALNQIYEAKQKKMLCDYEKDIVSFILKSPLFIDLLTDEKKTVKRNGKPLME